jgi:hypothetical protein
MHAYQYVFVYLLTFCFSMDRRMLEACSKKI